MQVKEDVQCVRNLLHTSLHFVRITKYPIMKLGGGTAVAQRLRCCAANRKVDDSIPAGVGGYFIDIKSF